jgi:chromate reductase
MTTTSPDRQDATHRREGEPLRIVAICGSLRARSFNRALLAEAVALAPPALRIDTVPTLAEFPLFDDDVRRAGFPAPVESVRRQVGEADGVLIATPEYNNGMSGVLKNALDWLSCGATPGAAGPLHHKPVGIMGASIGLMGTVRAQLGLRQLFVFTESHVMHKPEIFVTVAHDKFDEDLRLRDEPTLDRLRTYMAAYATVASWIGDAPLARHAQ